jgi:hypothetical protein
VITFTNGMTNPVLTNQSNGEALRLVGTIGAGEIITVDIARHQVTDQTGTSRFALVAFDSDWPEIPPGASTWGVSATSISGAALVSMGYRHSFI